MFGRIRRIEHKLDEALNLLKGITTMAKTFADLLTALNESTNSVATTVDGVVQIAITAQSETAAVQAELTTLRAQLAAAQAAGTPITDDQVAAFDASIAKLTGATASLTGVQSTLTSTSDALKQMGVDPANPLPAPVSPPNDVGNVAPDSTTTAG